MAVILKPMITIAFAILMVSIITTHAGGMSGRRSPYSPPRGQEFHALSPQNYFSAAASGTEHDGVDSSFSASEHHEGHVPSVVPVPFAADRRRKGKRKQQAINSVASARAPPSANLVEESNHGYPKKPIFCYYGSSANRRPSKGTFQPEDIDPFLCTHLIFAFVDISKDGTGLRPNNKDDLGSNGLYGRTIALKQKNPKLKILLAVGGWKIGSKPFLPVIKSRSTWKVWVSNVIDYLRRYEFDGFDMDWEFPGWRGSGPEDRHKFTLLMKDLHESFAEEARETGKPKLLLTLATASSVFYIEKAYEAKEIHKHIDYMLLMTYNFHGSGWEKHTGHPSPLLPHPLDPEGEQRELFVLWAVKYWLQQGVPKSKLVVGIPTYGLGWKLTDPSKTGVRAPADGGNTKGKYTTEQGILSHYEICEKVIEEGWQVEWIDSQKVPYTHGGGEWVGFESPDSLYLKAATILKEGLGGAFIWSVEMDDFKGYCGGPRYPLLRTVYEVFTHGSSSMANLQQAPSAHHSQPSARHLKPSAPISIPRPPTHTHSHSKPHVPSSSSHNAPAAAASHTHTHANTHSGHAHSHSPPTAASSRSYDDYDSYVYDYSEYGSEEHPDYYGGHRVSADVDCHQLGMGIHADPDSCQHFVLCIPMTAATLGPTRMACPKGTMYDENLKVCNHRHNVDCS